MLNSIPVFLSAIKARQDFIREYESIYAKKLALGFNTLDFVLWNENKVSEILAYFLDPNGRHAQGDVYLQLFINRFNLRFTYSDFTKVSVQCEETTGSNRRVDIVLSYDQRSEMLGIENKIYPWTADQKDQVKDYVEYLKTFCKTDNYQLVYLAPKSKILTDYSAGPELQRLQEQGRLVMITYERDIIPLLDEFVSRTHNERVRYFLEDLKRKLTEKYMGSENLDEQAMLAKFINESEENFRNAFVVARSIDTLLAQLEIELTDQMASIGTEFQIPFDSQHHHFELPNLKNCYVKYSFELGGVIYGIVKKPDFFVAHREKILRPDLATHFGVKFKSSEWWPLYFQQYSQINSREDLWLDIRNQYFSNFMKEFIKKVMALPVDLVQGL
ncbi:PDDEXK-like family protein [Chitinophaga sancti]|uniref:PD-(D/E)XK nuclease family protein n=1 Tax=Chitinophaga sancti TaxID=1004 RepID=A0A1K1SYI7_9BACT|nr:PD-(D/E)XK nuclease family protein [Chitinophaga sancti]WQD63934.1 PD-(D/E)XK nuclease family protein [Chitinophaga sancti]WQG90441.1 PD-(D/E)XK nuclease family protein [Chitinophaga sancti]SFW89394.1 PD-(D/E)XK nuclease superfamily protein [Chitinophaga sancti]